MSQQKKKNELPRAMNIIIGNTNLKVPKTSQKYMH